MTAKELIEFLQHHPSDTRIMFRDTLNNTLKESCAYFQKTGKEDIIIISFDFKKAKF